MSISMVALGPDDLEERAEWLTALERTVDATAFCLGNEVTNFEAQACEFLDVPFALGVSNGTDALRIGLQALGVGPGDEVIVPATSFFASASSVAHLGATPVFADVLPETLQLDPAEAKRHITERTKAMMPVHLYGQAAPMGELLALAEETGIEVIEDAAQSFDARYEGRALGSLGRCGTFSFYVTKNLAAAGDAGMIVTRDEATFERMRSLRVHGDAGGYQHEHLGWNARMDGFQGAILSIRLERLRAVHAARAKNAGRYHAAIEARGLSDIVRPLGLTDGSDHVWHQYIVRVPNRDHVMQSLRDQGIGCAVYYPSTLPSQPVFANLGHRDGDFPVAEAGCRDVLGLPIHHRLKDEDPDRVIAAIAETLA